MTAAEFEFKCHIALEEYYRSNMCIPTRIIVDSNTYINIQSGSILDFMSGCVERLHSRRDTYKGIIIAVRFGREDTDMLKLI